ncbi:unnamed protein product, partial [Rotaria socialis]
SPNLSKLKVKYELVPKKHKASRAPPSTVDFYSSDIIVDNDCVKQALIAIENLTKQITAREILASYGS